MTAETLLTSIVLQSSVEDVIQRLTTLGYDLVLSIIPALLVLGIGYVVGSWVDNRVYRWAWDHRFDERVDETPAGSVVKQSDAVAEAAGKITRLLVLIIAVTIAVGFFNIRQIEQLTTQLIAYIPSVVFGIILLIIGVGVAQFARRHVPSFVNQFGFSSAFTQTHLGRLLSADETLIGTGVGVAVQLYIYVVTLFAVTTELGVQTASGFIGQIATYLPVLYGAGVIVVLGAVVANYVGTMSKTVQPIVGSGYETLIGGAVEAAVYLFTATIALNIAGVNSLLLAAILVTVILPVTLAIGIVVAINNSHKLESMTTPNSPPTDD